MNLFLIILLIFVLSKQIREGFTYSINRCNLDESFIKKGNKYLCFKPMGVKESTLDYISEEDCVIDPNGNKMILYDYKGGFLEYTEPSTINCNPYKVMVQQI